MLVNLNEVFKISKEKNIAIGAFNCTNLETIIAVVSAAEELNTPIILSYAEVHSEFISLEEIGPIMVQYAKKSKVPICVHYDHGESIAKCVKAMRLNFTSVMIDASSQTFEKNIEITKNMVDIAHESNVTVEAELGNIFASEEDSTESGIKKSDMIDATKAYTDPDLAKEFVKKTGVDALAIAFGTTHGIYVTKPILDLDRISKIKEKVDIPLVMHGGSGLCKEEFHTAVSNGINKINYYTYLSLSGGEYVKEKINESNDKIFFHDIALLGIEGMKANAKKAIQMFSRK